LQNIPSGICERRERSGYEMVNEIGVAAIRAKSQRQTQHLIALADEEGI
jgi:kynureninase